MVNKSTQRFIDSAKLLTPLLIASSVFFVSSASAEDSLGTRNTALNNYLALNVAENYYGASSYDLIPTSPIAPREPSSSFLRELTLAQKPNLEGDIGDDTPQDDTADPNLIPLANSRQKLLFDDEDPANQDDAVAADPVEGLDAGAQFVETLPVDPATNPVDTVIGSNSATTLPPIPVSTAKLVSPESQIVLPPPPKPQESGVLPLVVSPAPATPEPVIVQQVEPVELVQPVPAPVQEIVIIEEPSLASPTYTVKRGDTLSLISQKIAPSKLTSAQKLVALFNSNPSAFDGGNMNRLRVGAVFSLGPLSNYPSNLEARKIVSEQYAAYLGGSQLASVVAPVVEPSVKAEDTKAVTPDAVTPPDVVNPPAPVADSFASSAVIETKIPQSSTPPSNVEVVTSEKSSSGRSITIALVALILAALGGYVFFRIRNRNRIPLD